MINKTSSHIVRPLDLDSTQNAIYRKDTNELLQEPFDIFIRQNPGVGILTVDIFEVTGSSEKEVYSKIHTMADKVTEKKLETIQDINNFYGNLCTTVSFRQRPTKNEDGTYVAYVGIHSI